MNNPTLKRGWGLCFWGENWKLCADSKWEDHPVYVARGDEPFHGTRVFDNVEYSVFRCLDDSFFAQPTDTCMLARSKNELEVQSTRPYALKVAPETKHHLHNSQGDVKRPTKPVKKIQDQIRKQATMVEKAPRPKPAPPPEMKPEPIKAAAAPFGLEQMDD